MAKSALWTLFIVATAACGPPPGMPPSPVNPPVKPPPPQTTSWDGEVVGADNESPADRLAEGPQIVVRPGDSTPARVELAPGWYADEHGAVYSREQQQRMVRGQGTSGTWVTENGVRVFRPRPPTRTREPAPNSGGTDD